MTETTRAILLMTVGMAGFAIGDAMLKLLTTSLPRSWLLLIMGSSGAAVFGILALASKVPLWSKGFWHPAVILRNLSEVTVAVTMVTTFALVDLTLVAAVIQVVPLLVTAGAAIIFGETVGWRRWMAVAIGFVGVVIILRPGLGAITPAASLALLGAVGLAARDLATRGAPASVHSLQLATWAFATIIPFGAVLSLGTPLPSLAHPVPVAIAVLLISGCGGYLAVTVAMRLGEIATVAPFRYLRLPFAMVLAALIFGERPDLATLIGSAIIVGSGLYAFHRERQTTQRKASAP
ncbi:MAG: DMT family transporter [Pseudomonadota bacterium]